MQPSFDIAHHHQLPANFRVFFLAFCFDATTLAFGFASYIYDSDKKYNKEYLESIPIAWGGDIRFVPKVRKKKERKGRERWLARLKRHECERDKPPPFIQIEKYAASVRVRIYK